MSEFATKCEDIVKKYCMDKLSIAYDKNNFRVVSLEYNNESGTAQLDYTHFKFVIVMIGKFGTFVHVYREKEVYCI